MGAQQDSEGRHIFRTIESMMETMDISYPLPLNLFKFRDPDFTQLSNLLSNHKINYVYPIMRLKENELI